ncbi:MAG: hypothetical protein IJE52_09110 [Bacteroidales bacterium]|nr:hypothetical protein [Bacteroidales bacterium]
MRRMTLKMAGLAMAFACLFTFNFPVEMYAKGGKDGSQKQGTTVAVVVDKETYRQIPQQVDAYVASVANSYRKGVLVVDRWFNPDSIRNCLYNMYKTQGLEGAVFIGDIPVPMVRDAQHFTTAFKMNQKADWKDSSVPSDRFYDDFDLKFKSLGQDKERKLYFYYSLLPDSAQELCCDIYSARIKAPEGKEKYNLVAAFLEKAVAQKKGSAPMDKILHFGGHGYNSESMNARVDEAVALSEQFQFLNTSKGDLNYIDFTFDKYVKKRLMAAVADKEVDLAILHHHGAEDTQYLNGSPFVSDPQGWIDLARNYFRGKMRSAKDKEAAKARFMKNYDVPASWLDDYLDAQKKQEDSLHAASMDIVIPDLEGYESGARMVILDACYNGAFNNDDYIACHYIFNPGNTVVVKGNSVNTLQDTWTNELMGLLNWGISAGNWAKGQMTLESHLIGDPTFEFGAQDIPAYFVGKKGFDVNEVIATRKGDVKYWRGVLYAPVEDELACDFKSLAIQMLYNNNAITSAELLEIQKNSNSKVLRLEAFNTSRKIADANLPKAIALGLQDDYELLQRLAAMYAGKNYSAELVPVVAKGCMDPMTHKRVMFQLRGNLKGYDAQVLGAELEKLHKENPYWEGEKGFGVLKGIVANSDKSFKKDVAAIMDGSMSVKEQRSFARARRNGCEPQAVAPLVHIIKNSTDAELRLIAIEALGWYMYSSVKDGIVAQCEELYKVEKDQAAKDELLKTINRLK